MTKKTRKTYKGKINDLEENQVFVFGSNPVGINGNPDKGTGGAALFAMQKGWVNQGEPMGNRRSLSGKAWGITTVTYPGKKRSLTPSQIESGIALFYSYAKLKSNLEFLVAYSGKNVKNLNGYSNAELANMFSKYEIPENVVFEEEFYSLIKEQNNEF